MQFVENIYPEANPNTDLDFENDILYTELTGGDKLDRFNSHYIVKEVKPAKAIRTYKIENKKKGNTTNTTNIYLAFIIATIVLLIIWYFYGGNGLSKNNSSNYRNLSSMGISSDTNLSFVNHISGIDPMLNANNIINKFPSYSQSISKISMASPDIGLYTKFIRR